MDFTNMTHNQILAERERLEAKLEEIKREQRRHDEIIQAQRKAVYDRLPETVGVIHKSKVGQRYCEFDLSACGNTVCVEWHVWVALAKDIIEADQAACAKATLAAVGSA
jgi:hypothetical protein